MEEVGLDVLAHRLDVQARLPRALAQAEGVLQARALFREITERCFRKALVGGRGEAEAGRGRHGEEPAHRPRAGEREHRQVPRPRLGRVVALEAQRDQAAALHRLGEEDLQAALARPGVATEHGIGDVGALDGSQRVVGGHQQFPFAQRRLADVEIDVGEEDAVGLAEFLHDHLVHRDFGHDLVHGDLESVFRRGKAEHKDLPRIVRGRARPLLRRQLHQPLRAGRLDPHRAVASHAEEPGVAHLAVGRGDAQRPHARRWRAERRLAGDADAAGPVERAAEFHGQAAFAPAGIDNAPTRHVLALDGQDLARPVQCEVERRQFALQRAQLEGRHLPDQARGHGDIDGRVRIEEKFPLGGGAGRAPTQVALACGGQVTGPGVPILLRVDGRLRVEFNPVTQTAHRDRHDRAAGQGELQPLPRAVGHHRGLEGKPDREPAWGAERQGRDGAVLHQPHRQVGVIRQRGQRGRTEQHRQHGIQPVGHGGGRQFERSDLLPRIDRGAEPDIGQFGRRGASGRRHPHGQGRRPVGQVLLYPVLVGGRQQPARLGRHGLGATLAPQADPGAEARRLARAQQCRAQVGRQGRRTRFGGYLEHDLVRRGGLDLGLGHDLEGTAGSAFARLFLHGPRRDRVAGHGLDHGIAAEFKDDAFGLALEDTDFDRAGMGDALGARHQFGIGLGREEERDLPGRLAGVEDDKPLGRQRRQLGGNEACHKQARTKQNDKGFHGSGMGWIIRGQDAARRSAVGKAEVNSRAASLIASNRRSCAPCRPIGRPWDWRGNAGAGW